jgi:hypothetical protein
MKKKNGLNHDVGSATNNFAFKRMLKFFDLDPEQSHELTEVLVAIEQRRYACSRPSRSCNNAPVAWSDTDYKQWYEAALEAGNAAGFVGRDAAYTIRELDRQRCELKKELKTISGLLKLHQTKKACTG